MDTKRQGFTKRGLNAPHLVFSRLNTADSDTSLSPSEFDRMINTNFPQFLAAVDDIGFESMRSDSTNITSAGLNTLYLQAKSTSTPSILAELSLSESTKKAINNLEQCLRDIGPESGIGISPADLGDYSSSANNHASSNHLLAPPLANGSQEKRHSLHSSFEVGEEGDEEAYQLSVYTTPENRVERQLYSLDGNRRSSFESVYSPNVVTEQVVNEVIHVTPPKAIVSPPNDMPAEQSKIYLNRDTKTPLTTSVTTSISEIISSPPTETTMPFVEKETKQLRTENQADDNEDDDKDDETPTFTSQSHEAPEKGYIPSYISQSKHWDEKDGRCDVVTSVLAGPIAGRIQHVASAKIIPKPRLHSAASKLERMESEDESEWANKVKQIAQWQADVNSALQAANDVQFIGLPTDNMADDEISKIQPLKPLRRRYTQHNQPQQPRPVMVSLKTFEYQPKASNANNANSSQAFSHPPIENQRLNKMYGCNISDDMFTRRFGGMQNHVYDQVSGSLDHQNAFRIPPPSCRRTPNGTKQHRANIIYRVNEPPMQNARHPPAPQVNPLPPCSAIPCYARESSTAYPKNYSSKYAEALSLATAANTAVTEAFNRRDACEAPQNRMTVASVVQIAPRRRNANQLGYRNGFHENAAKYTSSQTCQLEPSTTKNFKRVQHGQPLQPSVITSSFNGTGRIKVPVRHFPVSKAIPFAPDAAHCGTEMSSRAKPHINIFRVTPPTAADRLNQPSICSASTGRCCPNFSMTTRSRSVGPTTIPAPVDVSVYPFVTDLSKGLRTVQDHGVEISPRVQALLPKKFLLGRVASNEDICIETETPFAFSIATKGKHICISKFASAEDLQRPLITNTFNAGLINKKETNEGIPVSLRLTFGSTPCVNYMSSKAVEAETLLKKKCCSVLQVNMSAGARHEDLQKSHPRPPLPSINAGSFRISVPSLPKLPLRSPHATPGQTGNLTFFEEDI